MDGEKESDVLTSPLVVAVVVVVVVVAVAATVRTREELLLYASVAERLCQR